MGSARRLLLVAALAFVVSIDARSSGNSILTLAPASDGLITGRGDETTAPSSPSSSTVIGSAASDTTSSATTAPSTETTAPSTSNSTATGTSDSQNAATDPPSSTTATVSPSTPATQAQTATTSASKSTSSADPLSSSSNTLQSGGSGFNVTTGLPIIFGALACVGAIVIAVTYKKKHEADNTENEQPPGSVCEYTGGSNITPDTRALDPVPEEMPHSLPKTSSFNSQASAAIADFTGTNSSVSLSSPFGSSRCKARVSSPVSNNGFSSSEINMEFQTSRRHSEGSNVVLTIEEVAATGASHAAPQVQL